MPFLLIIIGFGGSTAPVIQSEPIPKTIVVSPTEVPSIVKVVAPKPPSQIVIKSVEYDLKEMKIKWYSSNEDNFKSYSLFQYFENPDKEFLTFPNHLVLQIHLLVCLFSDFF